MASKKQTKINFEKQHAKIVGDNKKVAQPGNQQQWSAAGDFFTKFSLYRESSSGLTSANTQYRP